MSNRDAWLLGLLAAIAIFGGILQQLAVPAHALLLESGIPYGLMALGVIFAWYRRDAQQRGYRRSAGLNVMIVAVAIISVPYYLFRSRGGLTGPARHPGVPRDHGCLFGYTVRSATSGLRAPASRLGID